MSESSLDRGRGVSSTGVAAGAEPPYEPDGFDEALGPDGSPRPGYEEVFETLTAGDLTQVRDRIREHTVANEIDFRSGGEAHPFHFDPVPRLLGAEEWARLEAGLLQRAAALNALLDDIYTDGRIFDAGVLPRQLVESADGFEPAMRGSAVRGRRAPMIGFDVVRDDSGEFLVLEENMSTPSGLAYAMAARSVVDLFAGIAPGKERRDVAVAIDLLRDAIRSAAPEGAGDEPVAAILTDGPGNSAWFEHRELASRLGVPLVRPDGLEVRDGYVHLKRPKTAEPVRLDVLYRRTDDERLTDRSGRPNWNSEALLDPVRSGKLGLINPFGGSVADDKLTQAYVGEIIRFYLGEEPLLRSVPSYDLSDEAVREDVLGRIDEMVIKPRDGSGGRDVMVEPEGKDAREIAAEVREHPDLFVAQETVRLSTHPTVCGNSLEPRHIDLRAFAIGDGIVPGGLTRVALEAGSLIVNSSRNGGAKDTWVMAQPEG